MKKTVKIIALFLSVLMCVGGLSVTVLAEPNQQYTISVTVGNGGFASVGGEPVFGGTGASFTVDGGGSLDIGVTPDGGYEIDSFTVDGTAIDGNSYSFANVSADSDVTISFKTASGDSAESSETESSETTDPTQPSEYTISVSVGNGGLVAVGDRAVFGGSNADVVVNAGDSVDFVVAPDSGYEIEVFDVGGVSVNGNSYTLGNVSENVKVNITFKESSPTSAEYAVNVTVSEGGTVVAGDETVKGGTASSVALEEGESLTVTVTPNDGYEIDSFTVDGVAVDGNSYTIDRISSDVNLSVTFKESAPETAEYVVRVIVGNGGSATVNGETVSAGATSNFNVEEGGSLTINMLPAEGREIDTVKVNGAAVEISDNSYTLSGVTENTTVMITFKEPLVEYNLQLSASGNGSISVGDVSVKEGTSDAFAVDSKGQYTVTITPDEGYEIKSLTVNGTEVNVANNTYTVNGLSADTTITAVFGLTTYDVTFNLTGKGSIKVMEKSTSMVLGEVVNDGSEKTVSKTFELSGNVKFLITTDGTYDIACGEPYCANVGNLWFFSPVSCDSENNIVFRNDGNSENPDNPDNPDNSDNPDNPDNPDDPNNAADHTVKVTVGGGGSALVGEKTVNGGNGSNLLITSGESLSITLTPDEGYELKALEINGTAVDPAEIIENVYTISEVNENLTVLVTFQTEGGEIPETLIVADSIDWTAQEIIVDVNGKEVSSDVFAKIASLEPAANKYVTFVSENGSFYVPYGGASGMKSETLNMAITPLTEGVEYNKILAMYKGNSGDFKAYTFNFAEKDIPAGTKISFNLGSYFGEQDVLLYSYTTAELEEKGKLEFEDGGATLPVYYSNEKILVCAVEKTEEEESSEVIESSEIVSVVVGESSDTSEASQTTDGDGGNNTVIVVLVIVLVAVLGAAALFIVKWRQEKF